MPNVSRASPTALPTRPNPQSTTCSDSPGSLAVPRSAGATPRRRAITAGAHVSRAARHLDEDERELADLGEPDPDQQRGPERPPEQPDHQRPQEELADHDHQHHGDEERND